LLILKNILLRLRLRSQRINFYYIVISLLQVSFNDLSRSSQAMYRALEQANRLLLTYQAPGKPELSAAELVRGQPNVDKAQDDTKSKAPPAIHALREERADTVEPPVNVYPPPMSPPPLEMIGYPFPDCVPVDGGRSEHVPDLLTGCMNGLVILDASHNAGDHANVVISEHREDTGKPPASMHRGTWPDTVLHRRRRNELEDQTSPSSSSSPPPPSSCNQQSTDDKSTQTCSELGETLHCRICDVTSRSTMGWRDAGHRLARMLTAQAQADITKGHEEMHNNDKGDTPLLSLIGDVGAVLTVAGVLFCTVQIGKALL
jgi:hypothetical protein